MRAEDNVVELNREREAPAGPLSFEELFLDVHDRLFRALCFITGSKTYPYDAAAMYTDETLTNYRLGERSDRLWERNVERYVQHVLKTQGQ